MSRGLSLQPFPFVFLRECDNLLAYKHQFEAALFKTVKQRTDALLVKILFHGLHRLIVIVADGLELPVKVGQADVVVKCNFVRLDDPQRSPEK